MEKTKVEIFLCVDDSRLRKRMGWYYFSMALIFVLGVTATFFLPFRPWRWVVIPAIGVGQLTFLFLAERIRYRLRALRQEVTVAYIYTNDPESLTFETTEEVKFVVGIGEVVVPSKTRVIAKRVEDG